MAAVGNMRLVHKRLQHKMGERESRRLHWETVQQDGVNMVAREGRQRGKRGWSDKGEGNRLLRGGLREEMANPPFCQNQYHRKTII